MQSLPFDTERPWGSFRQFSSGEPSTVKILFVKKGQEFSLQYHKERSEFWRVLSGEPDIIVDDQKKAAKPGDEFFILPGIDHRISAPRGDVTVLELGRGRFDEKDIVRIEDKYGRV